KLLFDPDTHCCIGDGIVRTLAGNLVDQVYVATHTD
ncbi:MAG: hypothetical protein ACI89J_002309, partial [Hyphomicrobiaceae bacterium]